MQKDAKSTRMRNLRAHVSASGMSDAAFADKHGMSRSYLSQLILGTCSFGEKTAATLEKKFKMVPGTLSHSEGDPELKTIEIWEHPDDLPAGVFAIIPRIAIELSAGAGAISQGELDLPPLAFREEWIRRKNVTCRSNLRICEVRGESMEPYLEDQDVVLIDMGQIEVIDNEVYAIAYGDELRIKRLAKRFDGGLFVRSDNPKYPEEIISPADMEHVKILGKKLWRGG